MFLNYLRHGTTVAEAEHDAGISARAAYALLPEAFQRRPGGRIVPRPHDDLSRSLVFYDARGQLNVRLRGSRDATRVAEYHNAVGAWLARGDPRPLRRFEGKSIRDEEGVEHQFLTDRALLNRFAAAGETRFESIYAFVGER
jgi:hypothetical protein